MGWGRVQTMVLCEATAFVVKFNRIVEEKLHNIKYLMSGKTPSFDLTDNKHSRRDSILYQIIQRAWRDLDCILLRWGFQRIIRKHWQIFADAEHEFATNIVGYYKWTIIVTQFIDLTDSKTRIYFEINIFRIKLAPCSTKR